MKLFNVSLPVRVLSICCVTNCCHRTQVSDDITAMIWALVSRTQYTPLTRSSHSTYNPSQDTAYRSNHSVIVDICTVLQA